MKKYHSRSSDATVDLIVKCETDPQAHVVESKRSRHHKYQQ